MSSFRTLDNSILFYKKCEELKTSGHLRDQLLRASSSVSLNLSEGNAKRSVREKKRFYQTAYASLKECQTIFKLLPNVNPEIEKQADHLGACLYKLMRLSIKRGGVLGN